MRESLDRYYTPHGGEALALLLPHLPIYGTLSILEPCAGMGALAHPLEDQGHKVTTADLDAGSSAELQLDAGAHQWAPGSFDGVITNPPFRHAPRIIRNLLEVPRYFGAYLLRLSFLEATKNRADLISPGRGLWRVIVTPRYSFDGKGTDSVTTAWFVWQRGFKGTPLIICGSSPPSIDTQESLF